MKHPDPPGPRKTPFFCERSAQVAPYIFQPHRACDSCASYYLVGLRQGQAMLQPEKFEQVSEVCASEIWVKSQFSTQSKGAINWPEEIYVKSKSNLSVISILASWTTYLLIYDGDPWWANPTMWGPPTLYLLVEKKNSNYKYTIVIRVISIINHSETQMLHVWNICLHLGDL